MSEHPDEPRQAEADPSVDDEHQSESRDDDAAAALDAMPEGNADEEDQVTQRQPTDGEDSQ